MIELTSVKCPDCGAPLTLRPGVKTLTCDHCRAKILISDSGHQEITVRVIDEAEIKKADTWRIVLFRVLPAAILVVLLIVLLSSMRGCRRDNPSPVTPQTETQAPKPVQTEPQTQAQVQTEPQTSAPVQTEPQTQAPAQTEPQTPEPAQTEPQTSAQTEPETSRSVISIDPIPVSELTIDPIQTADGSGAATEFLTWQGSITEKGQADHYEFTAARSGLYSFALSDMQQGFIVSMKVSDSSGSRLTSAGYARNQTTLTEVSLKQGEAYTVEISQNEELGDYVLTAGIPKEITDISAFTFFADTIDFKGQENVYTFTPARDGVYTFALSEMMSGFIVGMKLQNDLGETVNSYGYARNGSWMTASALKGGKAYTLRLSQNEDTGSYVLNIGHQKEASDLSEVTVVHDSIEYMGQTNVYTFIPARDGLYRFALEGMMNGTIVGMYLFNDLQETVTSMGYCRNGSGITASSLEAGKRYQLQIRQNEETGSYTLNIGHQKEAVDVGKDCTIQDSMQFAEQQNIYLLKAQTSNISIDFSEMDASLIISAKLLDPYGSTVASASYCRNDTQMAFSEAHPGEVYQLLISQNEELGAYTMTVSE